METKSLFWFGLYLVFAVLFSLFSYTQVDLNLTLDQNPFYLSLQQQATWLGYFQRPLATAIFVALALGLSLIYLRLVKLSTKREGKFPLRLLSILGFVLIFGYPLFSHDIFNYLFNAKMVWVYQANPHIRVAADFPQDLWLRFMHNIHTPAPYAYGWTGLSLIPGLVTITGNLKLSLIAMKLFIAAFWIGELWILAKLIKEYFSKQTWRWYLFALNPLVLIEILVVGHNDIVMMFLASVSLWFLLKARESVCRETGLAFLFLGFSVAIKYATIVLVPLWLLALMRKKMDLGFWGSLLLLAVMLTRPDQLHSWYLIWAFSVVVLAKKRWLVILMTALTLGGLLRYAPYLYFGNWEIPVYLMRNAIWLLSGILGLVFLGVRAKASKMLE